MSLPDSFSSPPAERRVAFLRGRRFAHRGLHGGGIVENSRAAFAAAIVAGDGIECDVRRSADGEAIVFHDATLERLTDRSGPVDGLAAAELCRIRLKGSEETIPRLGEMLTLIASRVPLLIEIKAPERAVDRICLAVRRALEGYGGAVAVMSFNPEVPRWFAAHAPRIARGLVISEQGKRGLRGHAERYMSLWRCRPDFLAYDVRDLPSRFAAARRAGGVPVLSWTVRSEEEERLVARHADAPIYERSF